MQQNKGIKKIINEERGGVAVIAIVMMFVLLTFTGLIVDGGFIIYSKIALSEATQLAAETASLAVDDDHYQATGEVVIDQDLAKGYAEILLAENIPHAVIVSAKVEPNSPNIIEIRSVNKVPIFFSKIFGISEVTIDSKAICKVEGN